jgi:hypothetical protein
MWIPTLIQWLSPKIIPDTVVFSMDYHSRLGQKPSLSFLFAFLEMYVGAYKPEPNWSKFRTTKHPIDY